MRSFRLPLLLIVIGIAAVAFLVYQLIAPRRTILLPDAGGTYVEGVAGAPQSINPLLCQTNEADRDLCSLVFAGLTRFTDAGEVVPDIATTWDISSDGITYTFKLRGDAKWHDGQPVTADDVIFTIGLLQDPDFPGRQDIGAAWRSVKAVKTDPQTVQLALKEPLASFADYTTIGLLPAHILSGTKASALASLNFNLQPVGDGPWRVAEANTSGARVSQVSLEPYAGWYGTKPNISRLTFKYYPNTQAAVDALLNGDVDGVGKLAPADLARLDNRNDINIYTTKQARYGALIINQRKDSGALALSDKTVRQALMLALDRETIVREALNGQAVVANTPFIPDTWAYNPSVKQYPYDPTRARQILQSAGYELATVAPSNDLVWQKDGEPIAFTLLTPDDPSHRAVAELAAKQWRQIGVQVAVLPVTRNLERDFLTSRQFQVTLAEILLDGDPDPYALYHPSQAVQGQNYSGWDSKDAGQLLENARKTTDRVVRGDAYRKFQDLFAEDLPALTLYYPTYKYAISNRVKNVQIPPLVYASDRLRTIGDWFVNTKRVIQ
ncbi:MAG TPA: peptide ABC transporter substrate-binding protein [Thermoflexales bacterium]|nr:peptide ABC transporter substrate-binding protein [Thermoflexales bacterium]HQW34954.1 peptide ABC transporter substrate-binding protein [Thermoflexales bacterium]HQX74775.1 peptide ABC transporter substrate-binding protein [Thermoflexales bacterium]HQZ23139.1 peptide ABC transporter substrate-binding protein [Thermoflexales bacterium]HRA00776.1 peptide ABC transporter substrate-binding protein [Thermoflexales bacterium]